MLTEFRTYRGINCKKNHTFWEAATLMESNCSQEETWLVGSDELRFRVAVSFCFLLWYFLVFHFFSFFLLTCVWIWVMPLGQRKEERSCVDVLAAWSVGSGVPQCVLLQQFVVCHHHCATLQCFAVWATNGVHQVVQRHWGGSSSCQQEPCQVRQQLCTPCIFHNWSEAITRWKFRCWLGLLQDLVIS